MFTARAWRGRRALSRVDPARRRSCPIARVGVDVKSGMTFLHRSAALRGGPLLRAPRPPNGPLRKSPERGPRNRPTPRRVARRGDAQALRSEGCATRKPGHSILSQGGLRPLSCRSERTRAESREKAKFRESAPLDRGRQPSRDGSVPQRRQSRPELRVHDSGCSGSPIGARVADRVEHRLGRALLARRRLSTTGVVAPFQRPVVASRRREYGADSRPCAPRGCRRGRFRAPDSGPIRRRNPSAADAREVVRVREDPSRRAILPCRSSSSERSPSMS
jgi:hypothetical protein